MSGLHQQLLENLSTAVVVVDDRLCVIYMNPAAEAMMEASDTRLHGQPLSDLFVENPSSTDALLQAIRDANPFTKWEAVLYLHTGAQLEVDYVVTPLNGANTTLVIELQPRDRLKRISREEEMLSKQETTRTLVRGLAHEIKNPLGGIRGAAQLLARELENPEQQDYTNIIIEEADRLSNLVDKMLGPVKPPNIQELNIHELLERVCQLISAEVQGNLRIERDYDPSIPDLGADREQLMQVLLNIARNAMQAMETREDGLASACLTLRTRTQRQLTIGNQRHRLVARIDLIDNGPGIPETIKDQIFYPMISGRANGTGLGLSIAHSIITRHQGVLECQSEPGHTCFTIYLPISC
ncbi:nitrogen regulation protein NR(II) [Aestuariirhabdus litorea]|uniref:Sensory histidine kinase/phosphatase NtrB n=1 Tax=Aestuariirhabdus litorea TaxID=2528527 RepID=A0A3P3VK72_9GAMM|nr:nitrogen regulation protein NR(II) [Aestuariirhabdus litorea]RRJ83125.1 nitrogen regulation protein NR(II) [Aestuariirhabdus litorea]RWW93281.1 nitrogen regulation protein NR(II) [Endozoicomonadaceae bacterium GTF-13]